MNSSRLQSISLGKVAKIFQKLSSGATGLTPNYATVIHGARVGVEKLIYAPNLAYAVVDTSETMLGAQVEEDRELFFYLGPGEPSNDALVRDEEPLLLCVRRPRKPRDALR